MAKVLARFAGRRAARKARDAGWLDVKLGFALMRDRRVPAGTKAMLLAVGFVLTAVLEGLEVPLEAVVGMVLPLLGLGLDVAVDGVEFFVLPALFASIMLTHLAPRYLVDEHRPRRI